jgi:simple sugar transport system ATP-binding protein
VSAPALELENFHKRFGPVAALAGARLLARRGSVHALLGENGAGKTTLMRIAFGLERPDSGVIRMDGIERRFAHPAAAIAAGVSMVHQHFTLVAAMTVLQNVLIGLPRMKQLDSTSLRELGSNAGLPVDPNALVSSLDVSSQQRVELLKAVARQARVLILDEPTASLAPDEVDSLFAWLRQFTRDGGTAVLITHKLREALAVADDLTVLRRGATVLTAAGPDAREAAIVEAMMGRAAVDASSPRQDRGVGAVAAELDAVGVLDARGRQALRDATLSVHAGEILGVAGVEGSGYRELLRVLAGRLPPTRGRSSVPDDVGFVPEDRHREALATDESVARNVALRGAGARRGLLDPLGLVWAAERLVHEHGVVASDVRAPIASLSGGNQQRVVVARELQGTPGLVVVENPTRGLDVGATTLVRQSLRAAARGGAAIVSYSADLDEVLAGADRVVVTHSGTVRTVDRNRDAVGRAMIGAA